jgi:hypothetical protein
MENNSLFEGLSVRDEKVLRMLIDQAAEAAAKKVIDEVFNDPRLSPLPRIDSLEKVVYGCAEEGREGMTERLSRVEGAMGNIGRAMWIAVGAGIVGLITGALGAIFGK